MQRRKKQKIQDMLDAQNAAIEADMVSYLDQLLRDYGFSSFQLVSCEGVPYGNFIFGRITRERGV